MKDHPAIAIEQLIAKLSIDSGGHEHKEKGVGGGQFAKGTGIKKMDLQVIMDAIDYGGGDINVHLINSTSMTITRLLASGHLEEVPGNVSKVRLTERGKKLVNEHKNTQK